ncbi:hypothetical protein VB620_20680 [Nodularia harveyana UHCC-0300]|uniref:Uncharacterized protein n=1 Tax=Nodularia harveyana UHCC-0300 TaxID=2974287 RepID=A0ABU5UJS0_9CYAN|nr:hypothetical protein [Nodularia harveyana]MEA5583744.1 hypothetical protein [Nodularia harveyana UHCC-0300]
MSNLQINTMSTQVYLEYFDSAIGLYKQGLDLLSPEKDDISIISGCILIAIGLEKFIKFSLEQENQLMVLENIAFKDVLNLKLGKRIGSIEIRSSEIESSKKPNSDARRTKTVSLQDGFTRLSQIFPELKRSNYNLDKIVEDRNFLIHGSGDFSLDEIEGRIRVNVTSISELICSVCLKKNPVDVFGIEIWEIMKNFREAYKQAEVLELQTRLNFLKRRYSKDKKLSCEKKILAKDATDDQKFVLITATYATHTCPICKGKAQIEIDWDIDSIYYPDLNYSVINGAYPINFSLFVCPNCSFTLSDHEEIEILLGQEEVKRLFSMEHPEL